MPDYSLDDREIQRKRNEENRKRERVKQERGNWLFWIFWIVVEAIVSFFKVIFDLFT